MKDKGLKVRDLKAGYRGAAVIKDISLELYPGELIGIFGPNGCGKSTLLQAISGYIYFREGKIFSGKIELDGEEITGQKPHQLFVRGLRFLPAEKPVFHHLKVQEMLFLGAKKPPNLEEVLKHFPILKKLLSKKGFQLSGGEKRLVALARVFSYPGSYLLLDEPTAGLSENFSRQVFQFLQILTQRNIGVLVAEQNDLLKNYVSSSIFMTIK